MLTLRLIGAGVLTSVAKQRGVDAISNLLGSGVVGQMPHLRGDIAAYLAAVAFSGRDENVLFRKRS